MLSWIGFLQPRDGNKCYRELASFNQETEASATVNWLPSIKETETNVIVNWLPSVKRRKQVLSWIGFLQSKRRMQMLSWIGFLQSRDGNKCYRELASFSQETDANAIVNWFPSVKRRKRSVSWSTFLHSRGRIRRHQLRMPLSRCRNKNQNKRVYGTARSYILHIGEWMHWGPSISWKWANRSLYDRRLTAWNVPKYRRINGLQGKW
jgi:hypothetical protein